MVCPSSQQALSSYIPIFLGGVITDEAFPEGGEGRIDFPTQ
jgi:hypothetical protein